MKPLQFVGKDEPLNTMQGLTLRPSAIAIARRTFVGRKLFGRAVTFVPPETQTYQYSKLTEMSHARTDPKYPGKENLDILSEDVTPVNIPIHHKEFVIPKADLDASRMTGIPLNTKYSDAATYQVGLQEDDIIINGNNVIPGLYNGAGNSEASNLHWSTATNIPLSIKATKILLAADHMYKPYNLLINPQEDESLDAFVATTGNKLLGFSFFLHFIYCLVEAIFYLLTSKTCKVEQLFCSAVTRHTISQVSQSSKNDGQIIFDVCKMLTRFCRLINYS